MTYEEIFMKLDWIVSLLRTAHHDNQISGTAFLLLEDSLLKLKLDVKLAIDTQDDLK